MKSKRHAKILDIIENYEINTQEALQQQLVKAGYDITQATVSRDIKELKLIKILSEAGEYMYAVAPNHRDINPMASMISLLSDAIIKIDYAINTVVIKCNIGMAQAVCAKIDDAEYNNVVGTLAGEDTIFVLLKNEDDAIEFLNDLNTLIKK